jgi:hypothetical protein
MSGLSHLSAIPTVCVHARLRCLASLSFTLPPDPPVYPHFDIYPYKAGSLDVDTSVANHIPRCKRLAQYPVFDLCRSHILGHRPFAHLFVQDPAVYPYFSIYPADPRRSEERASTVGTRAGYPAFNLCMQAQYD